MAERPIIFISHVSEDQDLAHRMKVWLQLMYEDTVEVFVSSDWSSIMPGDPWPDRIMNALLRARVLIALITPNSIRRPWIYYEAGAAEAVGAIVIPVCAKDMHIAALLPPLNLRQGCELRSNKDIAVLAETLGAYIPRAATSLEVVHTNVLALPSHERKPQPRYPFEYDYRRVAPLPPPEGVLERLESYAALVEMLADEIAKRYAEHGKSKFWVGISGPRQSGKTTLAAKLGEQLREQLTNIVAFSEDDFYLPRELRNHWKETFDSRFPNQKNWLRWDAMSKWFTVFDGESGEFLMEDLYDLSNGRVHLSRQVTVTPETLCLYEGQFLEDTERYPPNRFDFLIRLAINFETSLARSLIKDAKRALSHDTIVFVDQLVYQPTLWAHVGQFHPEQKATWVIDTTEFEQPVLLQYGVLAE
jgi:uridine kinase